MHLIENKKKKVKREVDVPVAIILDIPLAIYFIRMPTRVKLTQNTVTSKKRTNSTKGISHFEISPKYS